ncbi:MAG: aldo/keto reductase [Streptosporangiaceae bacterium]
MSIDPTERVPVGRTRLSVTRFGLGTTAIGNLFQPVAEATAAATVETAYAEGVRFFDTAPLYGHGLAERRVGSSLAGRSPEEYTLATKVGRLLRPGAPPEPGQVVDGRHIFRDVPPDGPVFDFGYDGVRRSLEESLRRLRLDRVDILHIHDPDDHPAQALGEAYVALDDLRAQGVIGAVGAGMNQADMLVRFAREADFDCFLIAGRYSLLDQSAGRELLPVCAEKRIAVFVGGVYNSGLLADPRPGATYDYRPADDERLRLARRIAEVCGRHDVPVKAAALQFPFGHPAVTSVLVGARSPGEVAENIRMLRQPIPGDLWVELRAEGLLAEGVPAP